MILILFEFRAISYYRTSVAQAIYATRQFPRLVQLHLDLNYPTRHLPWRQGGPVFPIRRNHGWVMDSMLLTSYLTAGPALEKIHMQREAAMVEKYSNGGNGSGEDEEVYEEGGFKEIEVR